jgi:hypothetical protein
VSHLSRPDRIAQARNRLGARQPVEYLSGADALANKTGSAESPPLHDATLDDRADVYPRQRRTKLPAVLFDAFAGPARHPNLDPAIDESERIEPLAFATKPLPWEVDPIRVLTGHSSGRLRVGVDRVEGQVNALRSRVLNERSCSLGGERLPAFVERHAALSHAERGRQLGLRDLQQFLADVGDVRHADNY